MYKQQADSTNDQLINLSRAPYSHAVTHTHHSNRCTDHDWMSPGENHLQNPKGNTEITTHLDCQSSTTKTPPSKPPETGLPINPSGPMWIHVIQHQASLSTASWLMKSAGIWRRSCPREQSEQYSLSGVQAVKVRWHLVLCRQHQSQSMQGPCELLNTVAGIISSIVGTPDAIYQPDTCIAVRKQGWSTQIFQDALLPQIWRAISGLLWSPSMSPQATARCL